MRQALLSGLKHHAAMGPIIHAMPERAAPAPLLGPCPDPAPDRLTRLFRHALATSAGPALLPLLSAHRLATPGAGNSKPAPGTTPPAGLATGAAPAGATSPLQDTGLIDRLVQRIHDLPPLPEAVVALMRALHQDDLSTQHCVELIERDPALAARTLRLANSAFYGAPGKVHNIGDAVRLLGLRTVSGLLTAVALRQALRADACAAFDFRAFWRHAIGTALAARALATVAGHDADEAFLAGLMHDIGKLALATFHPEETARAIALARESDISAERAELSVLGIGHSRLGALLARQWRFPETIVRGIDLHHAPEPAAAGQRVSLSGLLQVADALVHALDVNHDEHEAVPTIHPDVWAGLDLRNDDALRILAKVETGIQELSALLQGA